MHVQVVHVDGPRSSALVEASRWASRWASREQVEPLAQAHPQLRASLVGGLRCLAPDRGECLVVLARDEAALDDLAGLALGSDLLPGEDPALLPGPDRVLRLDRVDVLGRLADVLTEVTR